MITHEQSGTAYSAGRKSGEDWRGRFGRKAVMREFEAWIALRQAGGGWDWLSEMTAVDRKSLYQSFYAGAQQGHGVRPRRRRAKVSGKVPTVSVKLSRNRRKRACNPRGSRAKGQQHLYAVHVPKTAYDKGYTLEIRAKTKASARKEAKAYCADSFHKYTGKPKSKYRLPRATTVKEIRGR